MDFGHTARMRLRLPGWSTVAICAIGLLAAWARADVLDRTFASAGILDLPWTNGPWEPAVVAIAKDGSIFLAREDTPRQITVHRLRPDGSPDPAFGIDGRVRISLARELKLSVGYVEEDGGLLLGGARWGLIRLTPAGSLDTTFGVDGRAAIDDPLLGGVSAITHILPAAVGDRVLVSIYEPGVYFPESVDHWARLVRIRGNGEVDRQFGFPFADGKPCDAQVRPDGSVDVVSLSNYARNALVSRFLASGARDPAFGQAGIFELARPARWTSMFGCRILADGSKITIGLTEAGTDAAALHRYRADNLPDPAFAGGGLATISLRPGWGQGPPSYVLPMQGGGFLLTAKNTTQSSVPKFIKLDARGFHDPAFGDQGYFDYLVRGTTLGWDVQPDGNVVLAHGHTTSYDGSGSHGIAHAARLQTAPDVVEFYNSMLQHYFLAAEGAEARGIDNGLAGPGWSRTGVRFKSGGTTPVCRFYGTPGVGPNSHFFTIEPGECEEVKHSPGWSYEGLGFYATRLVNGRCAAPLVTVNRLYNNRAAANDSNHRYVTDLALVPPMTAMGWLLEGPVFCAKP